MTTIILSQNAPGYQEKCEKEYFVKVELKSGQDLILLETTTAVLV